MARTKFDEKRNKEAQAAKFKASGVKAPVPAPSPKPEGATKRKKRRRRPKAWASEAKRLQGAVPARKFIPKQSFERVAREILADARPGQDYRITTKAMSTLHEVAMSEIGEIMAMANDCVVHRKGHTLRLHDMKLIRKIIARLERRFSVAASA